MHDSQNETLVRIKKFWTTRMPVCPDCSFWTPDFNMGDVDHNGTWFCNTCWRAWENERKEKRLSSGKLLPEDRELWYTDILQPLKNFDFEDSLTIRLSLTDQFYHDSDWFTVDMSSLTVETYLSESSTSSFLTSLTEKSRIVEPCEASRYKTLGIRPIDEDEFAFDFSNCRIKIGDPGFPVCSLRDLSFISFPNDVISPNHIKFRALARESRKHRRHMQELEDKRQKEIADQKRRQQQELQAKQKELLQIAIKRAQNKKPVPMGTPPSIPSPPPKANVWSSSGATPVQPAPSPPQAAVSWSSRPMIPPPVPGWSVSAIPLMPPMAMLSPPVQDPWSSAAVWASSEPQAKRAKTPGTTETSNEVDDRQRMSRLGIPFRNQQ
jgi:hypothetical protein